MKAVVFTTDAIFALIIAGVAISILLFFQYAPSSSYITPASDSQGILNTLLSATIASLTGNPIAQNITSMASGSSGTWPMYAKDAMGSGATKGGIIPPSISFTSYLNSSITTRIFADYGNLYFATGNVVYALNGSTGSFIWHINFPTSSPGYMTVYEGMVIISNSTGSSDYLTALNAYNGGLVWSTPITQYGGETTVKIGYEGKIVAGFSTSDDILAFYASNGTLAWSLPDPCNNGQPASSIAAVNGSIAFTTSTSDILGLISLVGNSATCAWWTPLGSQPTALSTFSNLIFFGKNNVGCAWHSNGNPAFCIGTSNTITGVANNGQSVIFQTSNSIYAVSTSNTLIWSKTIPYGSATGSPVISGPDVYTLWSTGNNIVAQNISTGNIEWHVQLPYQYGSSITPAYGRLYTPTGNNLTALGACNAKPSSSVLTAAASMIINNEGGCATALVDSVMNMDNYGISINGSFAPAMRVATFNGIGYMLEGSGFQWMDNAAQSFTINIWAYPTSGNGIIVDELGQQSPNILWHDSWIDLVNANVTLSVWPVTGSQCLNIGKIPMNKWSDITMVGTYYGGVLNYSGYINGNFMAGNYIQRSVPSGGTESMYYTLGTPDSTNCGSGANYQGQLANYQLYDINLTTSQINQLYKSGIQGNPLQNAGIKAWYPLTGDSNNYAGSAPGYPVDVSYTPANYTPVGLRGSYSISHASTIVPLSTYAAQFNGNAYVQISDSKSLEVASTIPSFTFTAWLNPSSLSTCGSQNCIIFNKENEYEWALSASGQLCWAIDNAIPGWNWECTNIYVPTNKYSFLALTYDGSNVIAYYNGYPVTTTPATGTVTPNTNQLRIGARGAPGTATSLFYGTIGNVQIYNNSLDSQDISQLYEEGISGVPISTHSLVGWWQLNGNANDYSENANSGTSYNVIYSPSSNLYDIGVYSWH